MGTVNVILNFLIIVGAVVVPMAAFWYGSAAVGWGFNNYPKITTLFVAVFAIAIVVAALSFGHLFPHCHVRIGGPVVGPCWSMTSEH
jgi:hypothetical protein